MKILVIGDIMLDKNFHTSTDRYCPENKSLPIFKVNTEEIKLGGCANVAVNLKNLNNDIYLIS